MNLFTTTLREQQAETAHISQSQFAKLIGVNLRTLPTWPARALLKIAASNPKAIEALHG